MLGFSKKYSKKYSRIWICFKEKGEGNWEIINTVITLIVRIYLSYHHLATTICMVGTTRDGTLPKIDLQLLVETERLTIYSVITS